MVTDMKKDSRTDSMNEMEQIQRGLEAFLEQELDGYKEYKEKVRYRLIPFVW